MAVKDLVFLPERRPSGAENPLIFVFDTSLDLTASIPFIGAHDVTIDWGDGTVQSFVGAADATRSRTYASAGTFTVLVTGATVGIGGIVSRPNLIACTQWGDIGDTMTSAWSMFRSCANLTTVPAVAPASVTNMSSMFRVATSFNQPLDSWDVSSVTDMSTMFSSATSFNQPLDSWDVSSVTNTSNMFNGATAFNQPLDSWDVSSVASMSRMFSYASAFNQTLDSWDVSSVTNMSYMFSGATSFNQPLDSWDVSSVTNTSNMFNGATSFNQNLSPWVTGLTAQPSFFSAGANATFANNANLLKPFLSDGVTRINT